MKENTSQNAPDFRNARGPSTRPLEAKLLHPAPRTRQGTWDAFKRIDPFTQEDRTSHAEPNPPRPTTPLKAHAGTVAGFTSTVLQGWPDFSLTFTSTAGLFR
jgi:hypothetical protein